MKFFGILGSMAVIVAGASARSLDEGERLNRLSIIASSLQNRSQDGVALLTEAVGLCGFTVKPDSFFLAPKAPEPPKAAGEPNLHLYITNSEIKEFVQLYRNGQMVNLSGLCGSLDKLSANVGFPTSCKPSVMTWLQSGMFATDPGKKALTTFIRDLAASHASAADMTITDATMLDSIQSFLVMRVITEEIETPIRKRASKRLFASLTPSLGLLPEGYSASDLFNGIAEYLPKVEAWVEGLEEGKISGELAKLNPVLAVIKVVASYACLKADVDMEAPGAPLIRTKSYHADEAGEKRTLTAHFYYDPDKVTSFLNDNSAYFKALGMDPEMPAGDLAGVETAWDFRTPVLATQQTFRTVDGQGDVSKILTDSGGVAKVTIEGTPQFVTISNDYATPLDKSYWVYITPQLVKPDVKGGVSWAVAGFSSLKDGGSGAFGVITDFVGGMKVKTGTGYKLMVRDWTNAKAVLDLSLEYTSSGTAKNLHQSIFHFVSIENAIVTEIGAPALPAGLTQEQLNLIPEAQRAKVLAALADANAKAGGAEGLITFAPDMIKGCVVHWGIIDSEAGGVVERTWNGGGDKKLDIHATPDGMYGSFQVAIDPLKKVAYVMAAGEGQVTLTKHTIGGDAGDDEKTQVRGGTGDRVVQEAHGTMKDLAIPIAVSGEGASTVYTADGTVDFKSTTGVSGTIRIHIRLRAAGGK